MPATHNPPRLNSRFERVTQPLNQQYLQTLIYGLRCTMYARTWVRYMRSAEARLKRSGIPKKIAQRCISSVLKP